MEDQATSLRKLIRKNEYEYKDKQGNAPTQAQAVSPQPAVTAHPALGGAQHQPRVYRPQNFDFAQQQPTQSTAQPPYQQAAPSAQSVMNAQPASQMTPHPTMPNYAQSFNAQAQGTSFSQQRTVSTQSPVQAAPQMQASRIGAQPVQPNQPTQQAPSKLHIFRPVSSAQPTKDVEAKGSRTIAITSGKGGVGKTNLTVNLAIALGREGKRVLIIDADLGMANVDVVLGTSSKYHLMQLLEPGVTLEDIIIHGPYGVNYISGGSAMEKAVDLSQFDICHQESAVEVATRHLLQIYTRIDLFTADGKLENLFVDTTQQRVMDLDSLSEESVRRYAQMYIVPEDRERFIRFYDTTTVLARARHAHNDHVTSIFYVRDESTTEAQPQMFIIVPFRLEGKWCYLSCVRRIDNLDATASSVPPFVGGGGRIGRK